MAQGQDLNCTEQLHPRPTHPLAQNRPHSQASTTAGGPVCASTLALRLMQDCALREVSGIKSSSFQWKLAVAGLIPEKMGVGVALVTRSKNSHRSQNLWSVEVVIFLPETGFGGLQRPWMAVHKSIGARWTLLPPPPRLETCGF